MPFRHLFVCTGPTCSQEGAEETLHAILSSIQEMNMQTKARVTLCRCLGQCGNGPNMVIYPEGVWYGHVTEKEAPLIVQRHLTDGKVVSHLVREPTGE